MVVVVERVRAWRLCAMRTNGKPVFLGFLDSSLLQQIADGFLSAICCFEQSETLRRGQQSGQVGREPR